MKQEQVSEHVDLDDLYNKYLAWKEAFLSDCIASTKDEWDKKYYLRTTRFLTEPEFRSWWFEKLIDKQREYYQRKWEAGFEAWIERGRKLDDAFVRRRCEQEGVPYKIQALCEEINSKFRDTDETEPEDP